MFHAREASLHAPSSTGEIVDDEHSQKRSAGGPRPPDEESWWTAAGVVHDMGNVLTSLHLEVETLAAGLRGLGEEVDPARARGTVEQLLVLVPTIAMELDALTRQLQELRGLFKPVDSRGRVRAAARTADVSRVLGRARVLARPRLPGEVHVRGPTELQVLGDETALLRVLLNLMVNAAEAMGGHPDGRVEIRVMELPGLVVCDVMDNGPGVPPAVLPTIFQRKADGSTGRGHGLAVSRALMREMGGDLELFATGARGSTFRLKLLPAPPR